MRDNKKQKGGTGRGNEMETRQNKGCDKTRRNEMRGDKERRDEKREIGEAEHTMRKGGTK